MQSASFNGQEYWIFPKGKDSHEFTSQGHAKAPDLWKFDHPKLEGYDEYQYKKLPQNKKMIRLMKLYSGEISGPQIYCELMAVEYDKRFHIPTNVPMASSQEHSSGDNLKRASGQDDEDEGERSEQGSRHQEKLETQKEKHERVKRQEKRLLKKMIGELRKNEDEEKKEEEENFQKLVNKWKTVKASEVKYEALSWTWGKAEENYAVLINEGHTTYKKRVRKELALALKYLRRPGKERILWIDAICIDQDNSDERNHQVQMMSRIYTRARQVCIWLGEADSESEIAIKFIREEIKELKNFDTISSDEQYSRKWRALMSLMQREWLFRRWVVQEIALAKAATVYCGPHSVSWKAFAVAVELFVEVETATHRLSEVMGRDEKFRHVPGWFEYVSELGASLLVNATGKVFRTRRTPMEQELDSSDEEVGKNNNRRNREAEMKEKEEEEKKIIEKRLRETQTIDPLERRSLLSLEYLVTTMFIFQASEPRDVVYSLLAIARDAVPFAPAQYGQEDRKVFLVMSLLDRFLAEKPFIVDYNRPYSDVSRDFVQFSIERTYKSDHPTQCLDILCRPWALEAPPGRSMRVKSKTSDGTSDRKRLMPKRGRWTMLQGTAEKNPAGEWIDEKGRNFKHRYNYKQDWVHDERVNNTYWKDIDRGHRWESCEKPNCDHTDQSQCTVVPWVPSDGWEEIRDRYFPTDRDPSQDIELPSWVTRASQAPFNIDNAPGMTMTKTSRANADPLVGAPLDGHRNYNAAGSTKPDLETFKFRKRPVMGHYSLYVNGFELDVVETVMDASQLGSIPTSWLKLGGWTDLSKDPPDEFWRTIVADRGRDNRNPPYYYARACKESVHKGGHRGGTVNTGGLIHDEQNSIVAEFCRRVHAVIWNRSMFRTKGGRLGLASNVKQKDKVCILYGCTVPVVLREHEKTREARNKVTGEIIVRSDLEIEKEEDRIECLKSLVRQAEINRERKAKFRLKKKEYDAEDWQEMMDARQEYLEERRTITKETKESREKEAREKQIKAQQKEAMKDRARDSIEAGKAEGKADLDLKSLFADDQGRTAAGATAATTETREITESKEDYWYELISECYLHGMMDGEAMREKFYDSKMKDWILELR